MDDVVRKTAVERIRVDLDRRGWSQRDLADKALVGESTVFRLLKGDFTTKTLRKIERALELDIDDTVALSPTTFALIEYGGYSRELYAYYEQDYVCVRQSFADPDHLMVYPMTIEWCEETGALTFRDANPGYEQSGVITVPTGTQFLHFVTMDRGSARLITAYHMPTNDLVIRGMVMTFANPHGRKLQPAAAPILMFPAEGKGKLVEVAKELGGISGTLGKTDARARKAASLLNKVALDPVFLDD
ncbi:MAG: helix-turn-helix domain-containing protein [Hyphomicrobiaceae bacterium]